MGGKSSKQKEEEAKKKEKEDAEALIAATYDSLFIDPAGGSDRPLARMNKIFNLSSVLEIEDGSITEITTKAKGMEGVVLNVETWKKLDTVMPKLKKFDFGYHQMSCDLCLDALPDVCNEIHVGRKAPGGNGGFTGTIDFCKLPKCGENGMYQICMDNNSLTCASDSDILKTLGGTSFGLNYLCIQNNKFQGSLDLMALPFSCMERCRLENNNFSGECDLAGLAGPTGAPGSMAEGKHYEAKGSLRQFDISGNPDLKVICSGGEEIVKEVGNILNGLDSRSKAALKTLSIKVGEEEISGEEFFTRATA